MTAKFRFAIAGLLWATRTQSSFHIHLPVAIAVVLMATWLRVEAWQWSMLLFAIGLVLTAELLNTSIELLVKALHPQQDPVIGRSLDVAAGGVLIATITSIAIGLIVLLPDLWRTVSELLFPG